MKLHNCVYLPYKDNLRADLSQKNLVIQKALECFSLFSLMPTMTTRGEGFYAVIVICIILFVAIMACIGVRFVRQQKHKKHEQLSSLRNDDWQQLTSVATPLDSTDIQTLQTVLSNTRRKEI